MGTRISMQRELSRRLYADSHNPITGTNSSSTGTTITETGGALNYSSGDGNAFDRKYVYVVQAADAGARGESRITEGGWTVTGSLTIDPSIASLASGDLFIISDHPPAVLQQAINAVQRNLFLPTFFPLSLHVMGNDANDMEPSTIATDYSASSATLAIETTTVFNGAQSLSVTATSTAGRADTGRISVVEGQPLYAAVMCRVSASGESATFTVFRQTSISVDIDSATTNEPSWMELIIPFTVPSGCEEIVLRMISDTNTDQTFWDDVQLWSSGRRVYSLPSWITRPEQLLDVRSFAQGTGGPNSNDYRSNETRSQPLSYGFENVDRRGNSPLHIWVNAGSARPYIYALRPLDELSADTSNSVAEQDFIVRWAEKLVREPDKASETMALLRAIHFQRVTTELPTRIGVSM